MPGARDISLHVLLTTLALAAALPPAIASDDCPLATLNCSPGVCGSTTTLNLQAAAGSLDCGFGNVSVDRGLGMLSASSFDANCVSTQASALADDDYTLWGLPPGTPVTFAARVLLGGTGCGTFTGSGGVSAYIYDDVVSARTNVSAHSGQGCVSRRDSAQIVMTRTIGTPFRLHVSMYASAVEFGSGSGNVSLRFADLPPQVYVASCHGFLQGTPTAVAPRSWGSLKSIYRD